ncbi:MAG: hypothetical protein KL863_28650 [Rhizobium sp.]|nr:hypothetical protein [Rhizobium sp.]
MSEVIYLNSSSPASESNTSGHRDVVHCHQARRGKNAVSAHASADASTHVSAEAIARAMTAGGVDLDHPPVLDMPRIVWIVLRSARRFGRKPSCVPRFVAADLDRHCVLGDPTALLMRHWIADRDATLDDVPAPVVATAEGIGAAEDIGAGEG